MSLPESIVSRTADRANVPEETVHAVLNAFLREARDTEDSDLRTLIERVEAPEAVSPDQGELFT